MENNINIFGTRLREIRKSMELDQQELADMLHIAKSSVSNWERGNTAPDIYMLQHICHELNISADYMLGLAEKEKRPERGHIQRRR